MTPAPTRRPSAESTIVTVLISALLALTSFSIDISLPALPSISRTFRGDAGHAQLVVALFLVGFAVGQLVYGPLSDRYGRRPVLLASLALYVIASVACAVAPSLEWLVIARLLQGFGACAGPVIARAVVRDVYDPVRGARVLSFAMLGMSMGPIAGAMTGGVVVLAFHWRGVFIVLAVFGVLLLLATAALLSETNTTRGGRGPLPSPMRDYLMLLTDRRFLGYVLTLAAGSIGLFAWISGSPFVLMTLFGLPPYLYGAAYALVNLGQLGGASLSARVVVRVGIDRSIVLGLALYLTGGLALAALLLGGARHPLAVIVPMAVFQLGNGLVMPNTVAGAIAPFPRAAGAASALAGFVQMATGALSGVVLGRLHDGSARPMATLVAVSAVAAAVTFRLMVPRERRR